MDTIDSRRKFEKWFKDSLFAECNVPSKEALYDAWCAARAQDGGEPVAWLCIKPDGKPWGAVTNQGSVNVWMRQESLGRTVCPLYTHPPSAVVPDWVFDGYSVHQCLSDNARHRTSPENVSDTLDAIKAMLTKQEQES
jgi:hypothetical protein